MLPKYKGDYYFINSLGMRRITKRLTNKNMKTKKKTVTEEVNEVT